MGTSAGLRPPSRRGRPSRTWTASEPVSVGRLVLRFTLAGLLVMVLIATLTAALARQAGTDQAIQSARQITWATARAVAEPRLSAALLAGEPAALTEFNAAMQRYVLQGSLVRVKLWSADGRIIYSDESRLIGMTFPLGDEETEALDGSAIDSEISDLSRPENAYERPYEKLLEVYVGLPATGGTGAPVLFEAYFRYDGVVSAGQAEWRKFAPAALGGLVLLQLVQVPFAYSLARRLQRQQQDRQRLLQHAVDASDAERRRVAGDLHDGVVQQLTGVTYALDAARLGGPDGARDAALVASTAAQLRTTTGELRSLLVDIYPPSLAEEGLPAALLELAGGLERAGITVDLDVDAGADLPASTSAVLFRSAQEVLRNVVAHSDARHVDVSTEIDHHRDPPAATLVVDDDGRGFTSQEIDARLAGGHVGLRSLGDLVAEAGGRLTIRSAPGQGTRAEITVPLR